MRTLIFVLAGASLFGLAYVARSFVVFGEARIGAHLAGRIADLDDAAATGLVKGISLNSESGLRSMVELATSLRQSVAYEAQRRLADWAETLHRGAENTSDKVDTIGRMLFAVADELAAHVDGLGPGAAEWAARLSRRLVEAAEFVPERSRLGFLERCDAVLAAGTTTSRRRRSPSGAPASPAAHSEHQAPLPLATVERRLLDYAMQPGPLSKQSPSTALAAGTPGQRAAGTADGSPPSNYDWDGKSGPAKDTAAGAARTAVGPGVPWRLPSEPHYARVRPSQTGTAATIDVPPPDRSQAREQELLHAPLADVMAAFASGDRFDSAIAEAALRKRGMSPVDLDVARRLSDADAGARQRLLAKITSRPGANLAAWLEHFATDEAADVRLRALGLLATSRDEDVLAAVYARAIRDEDPRIQALAERLRGSDSPSN